MSKFLKWVALLSFAWVLYVGFNPPRQIVVDADGSPIGFKNHVRAALNGSGFWEQQLAMVNAELRKADSAPARTAEMVRRWRADDRRARAEEEEFYRQHPEMRPTKADRLREKADELENEEFYEEMMADARAERVTRMRELNVLSARINQKLDKWRKP